MSTSRVWGLCTIFALLAVTIVCQANHSALAADDGKKAQQGVQVGDVSLSKTLAAKVQQRSGMSARNPAAEATAEMVPATGKPPLTDAQLGEMLDNQGLTIESETMSDGTTRYSFISKYQTWTVPIKVQLSGDKNYIWFKAAIVFVDDPKKLTSEQWQAMMTKNGELAPNGFFCVLSDTNMLTLVRVERNQNVTPQLMRACIENLTEAVVSTYSLWEPLIKKPQ